MTSKPLQVLFVGGTGTISASCARSAVARGMDVTGDSLHGVWSEEWGRQAAVDHVAPSARRRHNILRERSDRPRGKRGAEGIGPKGARRDSARRFRQLDGHCRGLEATAHHDRHEPDRGGPDSARLLLARNRPSRRSRHAPRSLPTCRKGVDACLTGLRMRQAHTTGRLMLPFSDG